MLSNVVDATRLRVSGTLLLCKVARTYMKQSYTSSITFTVGAAYFRPLPGYSVTVATAGAMGPMAKGLAVDLRPVRVNMVSPGVVKTELLDEVCRKAGQDAAEMEDLFKKQSLLGRVGTPEDVAEIYLAVMKSGFVTGTTIHVEGGYLLL
ncbi:hypothetical protein ACJZ2D_004736 [Fusarium nematophilum]